MENVTETPCTPTKIKVLLTLQIPRVTGTELASKNFNAISSRQVMRKKKKEKIRGSLVDPIPDSLN